jgi:hypothetical protein
MKRNQKLFALLTLLVLMLERRRPSLGAEHGYLVRHRKRPARRQHQGGESHPDQQEHGAERTSVSNEEGRYGFVSLAPGTYRIIVDAVANFSVFEQDGLTVTVGQEAEFDPQLSVRGVGDHYHSNCGNYADRRKQNGSVQHGGPAAY